jgi:peptide deformylase
MRIKQLGHPILRQPSRALEPSEISADLVQSTLQSMKDILNGIKAISDENGNAISAPQVGQPIRAILLRIEGEFVPLINPEFTHLSSEMFEFEEECFSLYNVRGVVLRHKSVEVSYYDEHAQQQTRVFEDENAGLVQHEIDHLDGVFFIDKIEDPRRLQSIDYMLSDNPERLKIVKQMMEYMAG